LLQSHKTWLVKTLLEPLLHQCTRQTLGLRKENDLNRSNGA